MKWLTKRTNPETVSSPNETSHDQPIDNARTTATEKHAATVDAHALQDVQQLKKAHQTDPNLLDEDVNALREAAKTGDAERVLEVEKSFVEDSPYENVRAAVRNTDGEEVANTLRAWILGFFFVTVAAGLNMFLSMRSPAISIPTVVIMLLVYPLGCLWAKIMPTRKFQTFGITWTFNPGPFTIKEHTVVTLMANVTFGYAYATDALLALQAKPLYVKQMGRSVLRNLESYKPISFCYGVFSSAPPV